MTTEEILLQVNKIKEIWKPIIGYEGYEISDLGNVRSVDRIIKFLRNGKKENRKKIGINLYQKLTKDGYLEVCIFDIKGKRKYIRVHILVGKAFVPNPKNKPQINHKDGNKLNNNYNNLEWATPKENIHHAYKTGLLKVNYGSTLSNLTEKQVIEIRRLWENKELKQIQIAKQFNVGKNCIWYIVNRKTWKQI